MKPEEVRLEDERLRLSPEVMCGDAEALEEDLRLEARIRRLARTGQGDQPDRARLPGRRDDPGGAA